MDGPRLEIVNWLLGVLVLAVGVLIPLGVAASSAAGGDHAGAVRALNEAGA